MLRCRVRRCLNVVYVDAYISCICVTRDEANLGVLAFKISVLRQKLIIICATHAGLNLDV